KGGLSGRPVFTQSTNVLRKFRKALDPDIALIAAGGIFTHSDMREKLEAGADLVQVYTGLIYRGPGMVKALLRGGGERDQ
ncbi:MAG: nitronate monooxygenase, partial [Methylococcales bacterium]|nr:nitronate monooxygenase [Methylococcales bacterium]